MKQRGIVLGLILMLPTALLGLMGSETGSRWLLQSVFATLPATVSVQQFDGRLLDRMTLTDLHYQSDSETVTAKQLIFVWQPSKLFSGTLRIVDLSIDQLSVIVTDTVPSEQPGGFDINAEFGLPLQVTIENLLLTDASFQQGELQQQLNKLQLSAFTEQGLLHIVSLSVNAKPLTALFKGRVGLGRGFPLTLSGEWQQLHWPLDGLKSQLSSEQGTLTLSGSPNAYHITLNADLSQATLPKAQLSFIGKGGTEALAIEKLELTSTAGVFQLGGDVSWQDAVLFDLHANGQQFNPGILLPDLPGSLTFNINAKGRFADATLQLDAEIDRLFGRLRGYPVSANGKLQLADEQLTVDALKIISGANKIAVDGTLGQEQAALALAVDAPELAALWPGLSGSLSGKGRLQGAWNNPTVQFQADGKRLRFVQDNTEHSAERVTLTIDYQADAKKTSNLQLSANAVKTGNTVIEKVLLDGAGTLEQHRVNADITSSSYGAMVGALSGNFKDALWQGGFSKLDISTPDFGRWQLGSSGRNVDTPTRIAFTDAGIDMTLANTCLLQQAAALCVQGRYPANGDFQFKLKATELPTGLLQAYLPEQMTLSGLLNADAELQQQKGLLTGTYRLTMPAHAKLLLQTQQDKTELTLGALTLVGKLKDSLVSADVDLALTDQDYLRAQLQLDTGKAQTVTGHISAAIMNLAPVRAFVPQLSTITGQLSADLAVQGRLDQPVISGTAALKQGHVESAEAGFGLQDINLQLLASGNRGNRFQVQGEAVPMLLSKEDAPQPFQLKDMRLKLDADLQQQQDGISGQYRLELPANGQLMFKTHEIDTKIALGASSVTGRIDGTRLSADINLALAAQDYVRAQLQLDSGEAQTLSGQISASMAEFALLNPFAPQLSNIKGHLKADLALTGRIDEPLLNGALNFTDGSVDIDQLGLELRAIKLQALAFAEPNRPIVLTGSAQSGQGAVKLEGFANLRGSAELMLNGSDFEVAKLPEAQIAVSPTLKLTFAENQGKVTGLLKIPKAVLTLQEFPENAVQVSADEIILGEEKTEEETSATAVNIDAAIDIELGKQVSFSGKGLETQLSGKLQINKTGEKIAMYGHVDMDKARYKSYGQDLTVRKGRFLFNGPIDKPWLDVEAIRVAKSKDVTAILSLTGPLDAPKTQLSSQPALPEAEVLAYLVTGGPLNQVSKAEGNRLASAALSYGAGQASWLADKLGLDDFEIEEGQSLQDTLATVGQYLTPDFHVGAKVGLFNRQAVLVLKHKLTDTLNVETQAGTSQRIKLNYEIDRD
ncbi:MAG: translocation/assembly module TamB domain-containing protein [Methylobacter sp.]|nr:translocation/assembly module TamB domain-containing protein [Methylobacter sp.]